MAKRKRLEPLSADELSELLDHNPSKQGLERILRFDLDKVTTHLDLSSEMPPVGDPQPPTAPINDPPTGGEPPPPHPEDPDAPPEFSTIADVRQAKLRRVRHIQDGLTPGEFLLLTEMFNSASSLPQSKDRVLVASGYRTMAERTGQDPKTVKRNRQGLVKKLCIDIVGQNTFTDAAQCRVYHFDNILDRWRRAGMVWVRRSGRSVSFALVPPVGASYPPTVT